MISDPEPPPWCSNRRRRSAWGLGLTAIATTSAVALLGGVGYAVAGGKPAVAPGDSAAHNPFGGPPGIAGTAPPAAQGRQGPPAAAPGNSGDNPFGGPPGITGEGPPGQTGATPPTPPSNAGGVEPAGNGSNGEPNGPDGKITICHATSSETNPFVRITISRNGLNGHGDHHDGGDIVPAPDGPCPNGDALEVASARSSSHSSRGSGSGSKPDAVKKVAAVEEGSSHRSLPFTGFDLAWLVVLAAGLGAAGLLARSLGRRMS